MEGSLYVNADNLEAAVSTINTIFDAAKNEGYIYGVLFRLFKQHSWSAHESLKAEQAQRDTGTPTLVINSLFLGFISRLWVFDISNEDGIMLEWSDRELLISGGKSNLYIQFHS